MDHIIRFCSEKPICPGDTLTIKIQPRPEPGYDWLPIGETLRPFDRFFNPGVREWQDTTSQGTVVNAEMSWTRRKIESQPGKLPYGYYFLTMQTPRLGGDVSLDPDGNIVGQYLHDGTWEGPGYLTNLADARKIDPEPGFEIVWDMSLKIQAEWHAYGPEEEQWKPLPSSSFYRIQESYDRNGYVYGRPIPKEAEDPKALTFVPVACASNRAHIWRKGDHVLIGDHYIELGGFIPNEPSQKNELRHAATSNGWTVYRQVAADGKEAQG